MNRVPNKAFLWKIKPENCSLKIPNIEEQPKDDEFEDFDKLS